MAYVVIYHKPGGAEGERVLAAFRESLEDLLGSPVEMVEVDDASPRRCASAVALLPAPGGHLEHARRALGPGCVLQGPIPAAVTALALSGSLGGCARGHLFYWRAKRFREEQEAYMSVIAGALARRSGVPVEPLGLDFGAEPPPPRPGDCALAASVAPGRLARSLEEAGWRVVAPSILSLPQGFQAVLSWAVGALERGAGGWGAGYRST